MESKLVARLVVFGSILAMAVLVRILPAAVAAIEGPISTTSYINLMNRIKLM